jgi:hypothetical protein
MEEEKKRISQESILGLSTRELADLSVEELAGSRK